MKVKQVKKDGIKPSRTSQAKSSRTSSKKGFSKGPKRKMSQIEKASKKLKVKKLKKQKSAKVGPAPGLSNQSLARTEMSRRVGEVFSRLHQLQLPRAGASPAPAAVRQPAEAAPLPPPAPVPLKKPRCERVAFLAPPAAADAELGGGGAALKAAPSARGKKKRRKLKLVKRKLRREEEAAADTSESKLESARFRYLNEQLYTKTGFEALQMFSHDRESFDAYHQGFRNQVAKWPVNPLDLIIQNVNKMPPSHLVVDLGCGDARLATAVRQRVLSFDLVATNERVTPCDMAHVPLADGTANVVVLCLALMGTNLGDFVAETNRLLKMGGQLRIAEVASRFESVDDFVRDMKEYGFHFISQDLSHEYFYLFSMKKNAAVNRKRKDLPEIELKPCLYKRR